MTTTIHGSMFLWYELFMTFVSERYAFLAQTEIEFNNFV